MQQITFAQKGGVAILTFDSPKKKLNVIDRKLLEEFSLIIDKIKYDNSIKAVLLISGKEDNFIAGADIHEFEKISQDSARLLSEKAHIILDQIALSPKPYIAAIHGPCLGGGLEVALACHYRIATAEGITQFGSPEVKLGIVPAAGATQRLPRLIGMRKALYMLVQGKSIGPKEAYKIGLVDFLVRTREELKTNALAFIKAVALKEKSKKSRKLYFWSLFPLYLAKRITLKKTHGHYPAPLAILDCLKTGVVDGLSAGLKKESQEFGTLIEGQVSKNLIRLFFVQKSHQRSISKNDKIEKNIIGILGSGLMGSGIATISLINHQNVIINDNDPKALARAENHIWQEISKRESQGRISEFEKRRFISSLQSTENIRDFSHCNIIIEAVVEDVEVKQNILKTCEKIMNKNCIFASNTSSIPIAEIAQNSSIKERIIGMHYFSPVEKIPLLEIVKAKNTSEETLEKALRIGALQGKTIIIVNDSPGFYTTRIITALFDEACVLLLDGQNPEDIDNQLCNLGFPMGPLALIDQVGLDVGYHVSEVLQKRLGRRLISVDLAVWKSMLDAHLLGRKSGQGFYIYKDHKKTINPLVKNIIEPFKNKTGLDTFSNINLAERMLLRMVNEAAMCLTERVIATAEDGDVGAVFGIGFPPYLGGPFQYIKDQGSTNVAQKLARLSDHYGPRFYKDWSL